MASEEEVDPLQPIWSKSLQLDSVRVIDACFRPAYFPEHSHAQIKIAVPLEHTSIQVNWQTASGDRKCQSIQSGQVSIVPALLPREIIWSQEFC